MVLVQVLKEKERGDKGVYVLGPHALVGGTFLAMGVGEVKIEGHQNPVSAFRFNFEIGGCGASFLGFVVEEK